MPSNYGPQAEHNAQRTAAHEALKSFQAATDERKRARVFASPSGTRSGTDVVDITESVVDLLDMITRSMDWGSDFWCDGDLPSFIKLCDLLKVDFGA